ncbi:hypothetical protein KQX54_017874 [Cotesia glomerata]|uniref:Uncharacterized protein n=1 Tax=Cotesia glomerata TaxID=32391 RepID=A0AAV7IZM8_COTGL|nr:hypothetical protein KQX54_017874 [Cotesia glomerata]
MLGGVTIISYSFWQPTTRENRGSIPSSLSTFQHPPSTPDSFPTSLLPYTTPTPTPTSATSSAPSFHP